MLQGTLATMHHRSFEQGRDEASLALRRSLADAAARTRFIYRMIDCLPYRMQYRIGELVTNPGRLRHFYLRKKEIERQVRALLEKDKPVQVVVLGAGLDILCMRLAPEYADVNFIEIDVESSQRFKKEVCRTLAPSNVEMIGGDLRDPLAGILAQSKLFAPNKLTLWVAEGFFMFIPENSVARILNEACELSGAGSHIIYTSLPGVRHGTPLGRIVQGLMLKKEKTPFEWIMPAERMPGFMAGLRYELLSHIGCDALHKSYMGPEFRNHPAFGEDIHIARAQKM